MADLSDQTEDTSPSSTDIGYSVKDPGGTPTPKKATWLNILKGALLGLLTSDGDLVTRTSGAAARITRASLAADSAFSGTYAPISGAVGGPPTIVRKTADESVTSSTTLQNDDELLFAVGTSQLWYFDLTLFYRAGTTGDIQWDFAVPSGASVYAGLLALGFGATTTEGQLKAVAGINSAGASGTVGGAGASDLMAIVRGWVTTAGTSGNVQFRWAQDVSNGTATTVKANSCIQARRIS